MGYLMDFAHYANMDTLINTANALLIVHQSKTVQSVKEQMVYLLAITVMKASSLMLMEPLAY